MPESYSWEIREQAEELYIIDGLTYEQVAERTTVSISQLKRWGGESGWVERRKEYRQAQTSVRRGVMLAKAKLIGSVIKTEDAQKAYAFASLVTSGQIIEKSATEYKAPTAGPMRVIKTPQDAVEALQEVLQRKINTVLSEPDALTYQATKDIKQAMEMIEQLTAKYKPSAEETGKPGGLSDEAAEAIRRQILGLSK